MTIEDYRDRVKRAGILYVDVYPFLMTDRAAVEGRSRGREPTERRSPDMRKAARAATAANAQNVAATRLCLAFGTLDSVGLRPRLRPLAARAALKSQD